MQRFDTERATYRKLAGGLVRNHAGEYAILLGSELVGVYPTSREAYRAGLLRAGLDSPFYMHRIGAEHNPCTVLTVRHVGHTQAA